MSDLTILLVDQHDCDTFDNLETLLLKNRHHVKTLRRPIESKTRARAVKEIVKIQPDLLIMYIGKPESKNLSSMLDVAYQVRTGISIVLCGAKYDLFEKVPEDLKRMKSLWPSYYFELPITARRIFTVLRDYLAYLEQRKLQRASDYLEEQVAIRTKELKSANEQLQSEVLVRRRAEETAMESRQRLQAVFDCSADAIFIKDKMLMYRMVNPAMAQLLGHEEPGILGKTDADFFEQKTAEHFKEVELRVLRGETIEEQNSRFINGLELTFLDSRVPLRGASGDIVGICGFSRDITERQRVRLAKFPIDSVYPSPAMRGCLQKALKAAKSDSVVLLLGESGSGKDYLARYIHGHSDRANGPYFSINCAAIAPELAESELFGHEKGSFTGAHATKHGLLELAEGGILFLNEIGELSLPLQAKLLTFLDTKKFTRVGGEKQISVNARLMAATNRNLEKETKVGRFRHDLFYRLDVLSIRIPPLRERKEDIPILADELMQQIGLDLRLQNVPHVNSRTMSALRNYDWPGNVRELRNVLERGVILSSGPDLELNKHSLVQAAAPDSFWKTDFPPKISLDRVMEDLRDGFVQEAMRRTGNNQTRAAKLLNISRDKLIRYLQKGHT